MSNSAQIRRDTVAKTPPSGPLVVVSEEPFNAETRLGWQHGVITPNQAFYVRNHFPVPHLDVSAWRLRVDGEVERALTLTYEALRALPSQTVVVTLECAGNGRAGMQPRVSGEPWQYGAVSTAEWTGVPLRNVLLEAGMRSSVTDVVAAGADGGWVADADRSLSFARSLTREQALHPECLLAYLMNGEELPAPHGYPVRLIVPGAYGMASVKWVQGIQASNVPFVGYYQTERYVLPQALGDAMANESLHTIRVRSLLAEPEEGAVIARGEQRLRGYAWSGAGPIARVEVSTDGGSTWQAASLLGEASRYAWREWEYQWQANALGPAVLRSRAYDALGNQQPEDAVWNALGYANNAVMAVNVMVE